MNDPSFSSGMTDKHATLSEHFLKDTIGDLVASKKDGYSVTFAGSGALLNSPVLFGRIHSTSHDDRDTGSKH